MRTRICIISLALATASLVGCTTSRLETDFGTSHKLALYNQILDPEAEKNLGPVEGIDSQISQKTLDTYRKGFEKPAQAMPSLVIGLPGSSK
jgi:type IV pilus biogenesis protein CpaD/CtpE